MDKTVLTILTATDLLLPLPVFSLIQAGILLIEVWHGLPHMRARVIEPPQLAMIDAEELWWDFVVMQIRKDLLV